MKRGRPQNTEVFRVIPDILKDRPLTTPGALKKYYKDITGKGIGYDTINRALKELIEQNLVEAKGSNEFVGKKRKVVVYSLK